MGKFIFNKNLIHITFSTVYIYILNIVVRKGDMFKMTVTFEHL